MELVPSEDTNALNVRTTSALIVTFSYTMLCIAVLDAANELNNHDRAFELLRS